MPRKAISKRARFEVFKRDGFKCQYCGKAAPDVILHVDHIHPVSKGGKNDILNLITACLDCNGGKSNVELTDATAIAKQREQLESLNERREQLQMLVKWREGMASIEDESLDAISAAWEVAAPGWHLNDTGLQSARKLMIKFGVAKVLSAIDVARVQYIKMGDENKATQESVSLGWSKIGGICRMESLPEDEKRLYYIRGILRKRLNYLNEYEVIPLLKRALRAGVDLDALTNHAKQATTWSRFQNWTLEDIEEEEGNGQG